MEPSEVFSLSMMPIQVIAWINNSLHYIAKYYSILWMHCSIFLSLCLLKNICIVFSFGAIIAKVPWTFIHWFLYDYKFLFLQDKYQSMLPGYFKEKGNLPNYFPMSLVYFPWQWKRFSFSTSLPALTTSFLKAILM